MGVIDYEIEMFDELARLILDRWPKAFIANEDVRATSVFPAVSIVESSNVVLSRTNDSSGNENAARVTYTVEIYATKEVGGKTTCKQILSVIDDHMRFRNMTRIVGRPVENPTDQSVYRVIARYRGVVDKNGTYFRR